MANDGQIVFEVTADGKHAIADIKEITKAIQQETGKWDSAAKQSTNSIADNFGGMLKKLVAGFSAAKVAGALLDIGKAAMSAASDLEEVQNVVDVTFGDNANKIEAWAKNASTQFGLTETQAKKFTSTMGAMLKSSGLAGDEIVDVSTDLAGLAADMASFYNLDFEEAFAKIRSGISGQTMPLKELGIDLSVATLNAYALSKGLDKTFEQMSQGEQTMLRYEYLMQATSDAQGDFARTSDGYANSVRKLQTNVERLKTALGEQFIGKVTEATNFLNTFLELLIPKEKSTTVLDDFAKIDLDTENKLEQIRTTASEAREITAELEAIGGEKTAKAGGKVQQLVNDLSNIKLDQSKTDVIKDFVSTLANNIDVISAIQGSSADEAKAWLENLAEGANKLDADDAAGWATLLNSIKEGLPGFENTDFGSTFFGALGGGFTEVEQKASVFEWAVETLGNKTDKTAQEQEYWLTVCRELVKTIPGLSSIINTETGEIKGGTQAVKDYIKAWEDGQTKLAMLGALEEKESALASRYSDIPELQLEAALKARRLRQAREAAQAAALAAGRDISGVNETQGGILGARIFLHESRLTEEEKAFNDAMIAYATAAEESRVATEEYQKQVDALNEAKEAIEEYRQTVNEMDGTVENVVDANEEWIKSTGKTREEIQGLVNAAEEAVDAMADYANGVHDSMMQAVNSVAKGLAGVDYKTYGSAIEKISELTQKQAQYKVGSDEWKELQKEIESANASLTTTNSIYSNLESQAQFLDDYLANLRKAREMGLSNELLAELSDGSVESAQYLDALVNDKTGKTAEEIDQKYKEIQGKKAELAKELTDQQLTVDQTYQSLAEKAKEAIAALDLKGEAAKNAGETVEGIATGISSHVSDVAEAVNSIIAELNRLEGWGIDIDFGGFGHITLTTTTGKAEGSARMGLFSVPHDDYIARLHEGERVLSAQEAQQYNSLLYGGYSGFSLDELGGVMRDNVRPGGNVYLDGRVVGSVISAQQGKSYRQLQRSGWQA